MTEFPFLCAICGNVEKGTWNEEKRTQLKTKALCFTCDYWDEHAGNANSPNSVRKDGTHYFICAEGNGRGFRGFGGTRWNILFKDGRLVISTNLWYQGKIPNEFCGRLPDNATFISDKEADAMTKNLGQQKQMNLHEEKDGRIP